MKTQLITSSLLLATLASASTFANTEEPIGSFARIEGVAVVSKGAQYIKASEGMPLNTGDRLMVMEGGSAIIAFTDGCRYNVVDNEVLTIGKQSTCAADAVGRYKVEPDSAISRSPSTASQFKPAQAGLQALGGGAGVGGGLASTATLSIFGATVLIGSTDFIVEPASETRDTPSR